ncbi:PREDICTED: inositol 1,4,5-trisphosphate receptor-interacting protein-like 1 [Eurypyga helias]|uniref:inositol 1,4,5-trisphosphate receptor-interacting protein-like 1 n=1 Tax=Eurypyga helias TaxID=54383 RepID=UPI0005287B58|nr:PREDICTED: inositol 1,4,5-trisphosphate receptor-interacting protein-like 1 [Eurypyga helias]
MCQKLSGKSFVPRVKRAAVAGGAVEGWTPAGNSAAYRQLISLEPPWGHTFHLELGTAEEMPARTSRLRVELECTCTRQHPAEDMLCFLHHSREQLRGNQGASLLDTLCTGPYLDVEKTTSWFQILVKAAWVMTQPLPRDCYLTVLPSRRSCRLRLANASNTQCLLIEMMFGVQHGDSGTFLIVT